MRAWQDLRAALLHPERAADYSLGRWDGGLRLAQGSLLVASLEAVLRVAGVLDALPEPVRAQLESARVLAEANARGVAWETSRLVRALSPLGIPVLLLKGAAYAMADLPPAEGRLFADVDILVPQERLSEVEQALYWQGWLGSYHDAYDQRYYREWMHELPPLMHQKRQSVLDVHHSILPPTARYHPDPVKLRAEAVPVAGLPGVQVLAPRDMVIHSACHLFHEGEWDKGLRDLFDLDRLLRHFGADEGFFADLVARAFELELARPLFYALRYAHQAWDTPLPESLWPALKAARPGAAKLMLMDFAIGRAMRPPHPLARQGFDGLARFGLYVRGHWLRMPVHLLIPHLLRKAFVSP